jgi:hypothetical protein
MEKSNMTKVSATVLRARVHELADRFVGRVEKTVDRIRLESSDPDVRRRALAFKVDCIPAIYAAAFHVGPYVAAADVWGLTFQLVDYVEEGAGRDAFGPGQPLIVECAHAMVADADALVRSIAATPEAFASGRKRVFEWAESHPIEFSFTSRASVATVLAEDMRSENVFGAVEEASATIDDVAERINNLAARMPKQARWQARLLIEEMAEERGVEGVLGDLGAVARRTNELMDDVPGLVTAAASPVREMLEELLATERGEWVESLHQERIEFLRETDAIRDRSVNHVVAGVRDLVDHAASRIGLLIASAATLAVVVYWFTLGHGRGAARMPRTA